MVLRVLNFNFRAASCCNVLVVNGGRGFEVFGFSSTFLLFLKIFSKKIKFHEGDKIEKRLRNLWKNNIWLDSLSCSIHYKNLLRKRNRITEKIDPIYFFKSIKNSTEIKNMKKSHMVDGVALTKFLFWLKKNFRKKKSKNYFYAFNGLA